MSAAVATRSTASSTGSGIHHHHQQQSQQPSPSTTTTSASSSAMNPKRLKNGDKSRKESPLKETRATAAKNKSLSSPKQESATLSLSDKAKKDSTADTTTTTPTTTTTAVAAAPLAPPPRPTIQSENNNPDYFATSHKSHLSSEPNPFEQSFGNPATDTPGKSLLPPVASLTSPAPLGTGNASLTGGFGWSSSLRSGPLSPAMLSGPTGDYFDNIRSYPTPNESSLRTGLTPGGGGSMFPAPSPGTQALFNSFASAGATPSTLEFQRAAANASISTKPETKITSVPTLSNQTATMNAPILAQHPDNEAANGLFMLAQASAPQVNNSYSNGTAIRNNGSIATISRQAQDNVSDDNKAGTRKSKRSSAGKTNKRKTEDTPAKEPAVKKGKNNTGSSMDGSPDLNDIDSDDMEMEMDPPKDTRKMTDEEKRKNFLERNRVAALKCRQRKKQWLQNLQSKVEVYSSENDALTAQVGALRDEVLNLKTILIAHKDCPIAQQQATSGGYLQHGVDYGNAHYGNASYGMALQAQQAVGMSGPRRSS